MARNNRAWNRAAAVSVAMRFSPWAATGNPHGRPLFLPMGGHESPHRFCPERPVIPRVFDYRDAIGRWAREEAGGCDGDSGGV